MCNLVREALRVPPSVRLVLTAGELTPAAGVKDALWAADILKYLYDDLYLLVVGEGPERPRLEQFARDIRIVDHVRFLGRRNDLTDLLEVAELIWAPCQAGDAPLLVHQALASGRPVVASRLPGLAAVVRHGENGFLFPPGDKAALARFSRVLLDDESLRRRMGEAARRKVA